MMLLGAMLLLTLRQEAVTSKQPLELAPATGSLVAVDVVVKDKKGQPVQNLRPEDFEVHEDGRSVVVRAFLPPVLEKATTAEGAQAGSQPIASPTTTDQPTLVIYFDSLALSAGGRTRAIQQAKGIARSRLAEGARVLVLTEDQGLRALTQVTPNADELNEAIDRVKAWGAEAPGLMDERGVLADIQALVEVDCSVPFLLPLVRGYANRRVADALQAADRLSILVNVVGALPGRKDLIYVSEGLEERPGIHLFAQLPEICPAANSQDLQSVFSAIQEFNTWAMFKSETARANAGRITLYPIDARGLAPATAMDVSRGLKRFIPSATNDNVRAANLTYTYERLAEETGGFALLRGRDAVSAMKEFDSDRRGRYVLGIEPQGGADGKIHGVSVRVKAKAAANVRYRQSFVYANPVAKRSQKALATLIYGIEEDALGVSVEIEPSTDAEGNATLRFIVPLGTLQFEPAAGGRTAELRVMVAFRPLRQSGGPATVLREKEFSIQADAETEELGREFVIDLPLGPVDCEVAVGIEDTRSGRATYVRRVVTAAAGPR